MEKKDGLIIPSKISSRKNEERQYLDNDQNFFRINKNMHPLYRGTMKLQEPKGKEILPRKRRGRILNTLNQNKGFSQFYIHFQHSKGATLVKPMTQKDLYITHTIKETFFTQTF